MNVVMHVVLPPYALLQTDLPNGTSIAFRQSHGIGAGTVVLLHGIGSNSASWAAQLAHGLNAGRVLAWDAPGYGQKSSQKSGEISDEIPCGSSPVALLRPAAQNYAEALWHWLDALGVVKVHLVGHSLGCIMAARAAVIAPQRVHSLTLLSPAQGYAAASQADREAKRAQRLDALTTLGPQGMAELRSAAMLSPLATQVQKEAVKALMASIHPAGYTQAVHLLMDADIHTDLALMQLTPQLKIRVACGGADTITPPVQSAALAAKFHLPYTEIPNAGHALAIEAPDALNEFLTL